MANNEFTAATRKFADDESAKAMAAIYDAASKDEQEKLLKAAEEFSRLHTSNDSLVRDRSKNYITNAIMDAAEKNADKPTVQTAIATLTGDANAGAALQAAAHSDEQIDQIRGQIHDVQRPSRSSTSPTIKGLEAKIHTIEGAHEGLHDKVAQHLDDSSQKRQPAVAAAQSASTQPTTEQAKDDNYLADALKDMRKEDPRIDKLLAALKEAGADESKRKAAAKDLAEEVVKFAEKHPESKTAAAAVERLAPGKGADLLDVVADSDKQKTKANETLAKLREQARDGANTAWDERKAVEAWRTQDNRHDAAHDSLVSALTDKITNGEQPAPRQAAPAVAADTATAPEPAPAPKEPAKYTGKHYVTKVPTDREDPKEISGFQLQQALKQLAKDKGIEIDLGKHGVNGVDGKVGGETLQAFNKIFKTSVSDPNDLKITGSQAGEIVSAAHKFRTDPANKAEVEQIDALASKAVSHRIRNIPASHNAEHDHKKSHETGAAGSSAPAQKSGGKPAGHKPDAAEHTTAPKTVNYMIADELKPINPKLIQQMVAAGGSSDTDKLLDMKWFNERAKFVENTYAKTNDGIAYAASHGGKQKVWNEALADMMHTKAEPIIAGMKPAAVQAAAEPAPVTSSIQKLGEKGIRELAASLSHNDGMRDGHTSMAAVNKAIETSLGNTKDVVADGKLTDKELVAALSKYAQDHKVSVMNADEAILKAVAANANQFDPLGGAVALRTPGSKDTGSAGGRTF